MMNVPSMDSDDLPMFGSKDPYANKQKNVDRSMEFGSADSKDKGLDKNDLAQHQLSIILSSRGEERSDSEVESNFGDFREPLQTSDCEDDMGAGTLLAGKQTSKSKRTKAQNDKKESIADKSGIRMCGKEEKACC